MNVDIKQKSQIRDMLNSILLKDKPSYYIYKLIQTGQINNIMPELIKLKGFEQRTKYHNKDVLDHTMAVVDAISPKLNLRMAALLHDISKPECFTIDASGVGHFKGHHIKSAERTQIILERLGYESHFIYDVRTLVRYHYLKDVDKSSEGIKGFINNVGVNRLDDMFELNEADIKGKSNVADFEVVEQMRRKCQFALRTMGDDSFTQ